jgi:YVTN family beta-propeller protein
MNDMKIGAVVLVGAALFGAATAVPAAPYAYIANSGSASVSVIDTASDQVVATIPVGAAPWGVAVGPGGERVYVTNSNSNSVSVIDGATQTVIATIPVGQRPMGIAASECGRWVVVANQQDGTASLIDGFTLKVKNVVAVGALPQAVSEDRYWCDFDSAADFFISRVDGSGSIQMFQANNYYSDGQLSSPHPVWLYPSGLYGSEAPIPTALASIGNGLVAAADAANGQLTFSSPPEPDCCWTGWPPASANSALMGLAYSPHTGSFYLTDPFTDRLLLTYYANGGLADVVDLEVGHGPMGVAVRPQGDKVYVVNRDSNSVSVVDAYQFNVISTIPVGDAPVAMGEFIGTQRDLLPDPFSFAPVKAVSSTWKKVVAVSNSVTVTGFDAQVPTLIRCPAATALKEDECSYSVNGGAWTTQRGVLSPGPNQVRVRLVAPTYNPRTRASMNTATLKVGGQSATFVVKPF